MKRTLALGLLLIATAASSADLALATRHDELRALDVAPSRASPSRKVQWAPSGNFQALHARAVFGSETETASRPYARERAETAAGAGIFLSRESVEGQLNSAPSLHRFAYARNSPLRYTDPTGHDWTDLLRLATSPPKPYQDPVQQVPAEILRDTAALPATGYARYEAFVDRSQAAVNAGAQNISYDAQVVTRSAVSDTGANLVAAGVSAVTQFVAGIPFGAINFATRPHRVVEGIGSIPSRFVSGVRIAADDSLSLDQRAEGVAQAVGAASQALLLVAGTAKLLGVEGPALSVPKFLSSPAAKGSLGQSGPPAFVWAEHGTTMNRAMSIMKDGPNAGFVEPGSLPAQTAGEFAVAPVEGLHPMGTAAQYARFKSGLFPAEGGPAIVRIKVPTPIVTVQGWG